MKIEDLVEQYNYAWNRRDVDGILCLMHKGAAFYDAFWMESCVGSNLTQYFMDAFEEEPFWYQQVGDVIATQNSAVLRYAAYRRSHSNADAPLYHGAEVFTLEDALILTVSDYYCNPDPEILIEIAALAARRHGLPNHVNSGLGALRALRLRDRLAKLVGKDEASLPPDMTLSELAGQIGCTTDQLLNVIDTEYGTTFSEAANRLNSTFVSDILPKKSFLNP